MICIYWLIIVEKIWKKSKAKKLQNQFEKNSNLIQFKINPLILLLNEIELLKIFLLKVKIRLVIILIENNTLKSKFREIEINHFYLN